MATITVHLDVQSTERVEQVAETIRAMLALTAISNDVTVTKYSHLP